MVKYHFEGEEDRRPDYHLGRIHLLFRMHHKDLSVPCVHGMEQRDCDQCGGAWRDFALVRRMMPAERKQTGRFPYLSVEKKPAGDFDPAGERDKHTGTATAPARVHWPMTLISVTDTELLKYTDQIHSPV